jgi:hypothetical protein
MMAHLFDELSGRGLAGVAGVVAGSFSTWAVSRWKRHQQKHSVLVGDARDTIVVAQHLVETEERPDPKGYGTRTVAKAMRIRSLGQSELDRVVPNGHLSGVLLHRALGVSPHDTLISMAGVEGSYLLETLTNFVCDRVGNEPFEHDLYVMAPCCEPAELAQHQPITILLISQSDLELFENWETCHEVSVEHSSDAARVLTLMNMARRYKQELAELDRLRREGKPTTYAETMYVLDLALDTQCGPIPTKSIRWDRYLHLHLLPAALRSPTSLQSVAETAA